MVVVVLVLIHILLHRIIISIILNRSLPNDEISICITDTTILLPQTKVENSITSTPLLHLSKEILQVPCPLPGLEACYSLLLSTILYYGLYKDQIKQSTLSLYKGILLCGDHGVGKSKIVSLFLLILIWIDSMCYSIL